MRSRTGFGLQNIRKRLVMENKEQEGAVSELVIQGSHMVGGTRCPAGSDPVKKWSESRAAAPKGRCPVEHRGNFNFPDVLRGHISGLR